MHFHEMNETNRDSTRITFQALLLDMDGLLLDTERVAQDAWRKAELITGHKMPDGFYDSVIGRSMKFIAGRLKEVMDPTCDVEAFLETANRSYQEVLTQSPIPVKPGALRLLEYCEKRGIPRCLATSTGRELAKHKLESTGLLPFLPHRVCGDDIAHSKPEPDIYLAAASQIDQPTVACLAMEDSEHGINAALAAGCQIIHVPDLSRVSVDVQVRVNAIFQDLHNVVDAIEAGHLEFIAS